MTDKPRASRLLFRLPLGLGVVPKGGDMQLEGPDVPIAGTFDLRGTPTGR
jgi:hypothetical protein